jgi:hypothetical protein
MTMPRLRSGSFRPSPADVFMVAYDEPNAAENWKRLQQLCPRAQLVSGIAGIQAAYRACAFKATTPHFFAVDADNFVLGAATFMIRLRPRPDQVYVWSARNPINGLVYGHGGVKLYPTALMRRPEAAPGIDISTSIGSRTRRIRQVASEHRFDTSPYRAWSTAYREAVKLALAIAAGHQVQGAQFLLDMWCSKGEDAPFGRSCIAGAKAGRAYGMAHSHDASALARINDAGWLHEQFAKSSESTAEA